MARQKKSVKEKHIGIFLNSARQRAKRDSVPFSLTVEYLVSIATDECPVFHTPFEWGLSGLGNGNAKPNGPTLDRVEPHLGYVEGNVAFISNHANRMKDDGTMQDHYDIADWIWSHLYAKPNTTPPIPKRTNLKGIIHSESRSVLASGTGKDYDNPNYNSGTVQRYNLDYRAQTGGGERLGAGDAEVGTLKASYSFQNYGVGNIETISFDRQSGRVSYQFRERDMVSGTKPNAQVYQLGDRREQSLQGSVHQTVQSTEEAPEEFSTSDYSYGYSNTTGVIGSMGTSRYLGPGAATGNQSNEVQGQVSPTGSDEPPDTCYIQLED